MKKITSLLKSKGTLKTCEELGIDIITDPV